MFAAVFVVSVHVFCVWVWVDVVCKCFILSVALIPARDYLCSVFLQRSLCLESADVCVSVCSNEEGSGNNHCVSLTLE